MDRRALVRLIELAKAEDLGCGDVTGELCIAPDQRGVGELVMRSPGAVCGLAIAPSILACYDRELRLDLAEGVHDGRFLTEVPAGLGQITGPLRSLLACERILLNFLQRLSGVATATRGDVARVSGTKARIYDTRKTTPGWRALEKYAVRCGGGRNHRMGLYDAVLIKDNHLAGVSGHGLAERVRRVVADAGRRRPRPDFIEVEVDTIEQFRVLLGIAGVDAILLDNMDESQMEACVELRDRAGWDVQLEASGGIDADSARGAALAGVDRISVGALTHSAPAADIALDVIGP